MKRCKYCEALKTWDDDLQEEIDYCTCEMKNRLDSNNYNKEYDSYTNEVYEKNCKYYLCDTCKFKDILEQKK